MALVMTLPEKFSPKGWARRVGVVLAAVLLLAIAGEVALRLVPGFANSQTVIKSQQGLASPEYALDPELGALLAPGRSYTFETLDFTYKFETDHAGFPNAEPWPGRIEVAVLGNSLLGGAGVGRDGQFTTLLARRLAGRKVLNLSLPGGGTEHQLLTYRRYAAPLQPKLVLAFVWAVWEIENGLHFERWQRQESDPDYTHYRKTYKQTHATGAPAVPSMGEKIRQVVLPQLAQSYLLRAGYQGFPSLFGREPMRKQVTFPNGDTIFLSVRDQERLAQGMDRPGEPGLRELFFRPLEQLRTEVEAHGGRFAVVLMPSKEELYGAEVFAPVLRADQEIKAGLEARGLPFLDLYPAFRELDDPRPPFYRADIHPNAFGNQIVADALAKWIADQNIFTTPPRSRDRRRRWRRSAGGDRRRRGCRLGTFSD